MDIEELWQKAVTKTEVYRSRLRSLYTFSQTTLPYIYLAESTVNTGDVVVRRGKIVLEKPLILLPGNFPQFNGFEINEKDAHFDNDAVATFLFVRGITFPTMKYSNETHKLDVVPGPLSKVIERYKLDLEKKEDVTTGLIISPEDCWQFSVLIYVSILMAKSLPEDIRNILKRMGIENN